MMCDFVLCGYMDDGDVVCSHVCCCYDCEDCGDLVMPRKRMVVCYMCVAEWDDEL